MTLNPLLLGSTSTATSSLGPIFFSSIWDKESTTLKYIDIIDYDELTIFPPLPFQDP